MFDYHIYIGYRLEVETARAAASAHAIRKMVRGALLAVALLALGVAPALAARPQSTEQQAAVIAVPVPRAERGANPARLLFRATNGTVVGSEPPIDW